MARSPAASACLSIGNGTCHPSCASPAAFATGALYATPLPFRLTYIDYLSELYFMDAAVEEALTLSPATSSAQVSGV